MNNKKRDMITTIILIFFMASLLGYNLYQVQVARAVVQAREEYHSRLEAQQLERIAIREAIKESINSKKIQEQKTANDIIEFNDKRDSFLEKVENLSAKFDNGVVNIQELKQLTVERIDISEKFKQEILSINKAPGPLGEFYNILFEFLEKDIENWNLILFYYSGEEPPEGLQLKIKQANDLYQKAEEERIRVYFAYELEDLLE